MGDDNKVGRLGEILVLAELEEIYKDVRETPKKLDMQLKWADMVCVRKRLGIPNLKVEVKTEWDYTGNFYMETISNKDLGRDGWAKTSTADEFYYLFWNQKVGYRIRNFQNFLWIFDYYQAEFPLRQQGKNVQSNRTFGRVVPINWIKEMGHIGFSKFKLTDEQQQYAEHQYELELQNGSSSSR